MTDGPVPRVSVCIPTYQGQDTIASAIDSVLAQTMRDFELIVVDDASTDDTRTIVASYADPRVRLVCNPRRMGPAGNWNRCLQLARGRYFKLLPHDDLLRPQCLERQANRLDADPAEQLAFVSCARDVIDAAGCTVLQRRYPGQPSARVEASQVMRACVRHGTNLIGEPGAVLFRTELALRVGEFDAQQPYVIDLDYWSRLLQHGDAHFCPEPLVAFRVSNRSWSARIGRRQARDFVDFVDRIGATGRWPLTGVDRLLARIAAVVNTGLRLGFYAFHGRHVGPPVR